MLAEGVAPKIDFPRKHPVVELAILQNEIGAGFPEEMTPRRTAESLGEFLEVFGQNDLNNFMSGFRKMDLEEPREFVIKPVFGEGENDFGEGTGRFFMDASLGIGLGVKDENSEDEIWVAVAGIAIGNELDSYSFGGYRKKEAGRGRMDFAYQFPVIVQLQGPASQYDYIDSKKRTYPQRYEKARKVLEEYKWERALIEIILEWSISNDIPAVYLLPGNLNKWLEIPPSSEKEEGFKMRYDVSAKRLGFKMQPNGLWGISLL